MQPIDPNHLDSIRGGFGALLGTLAQSAGPILNGVANVIGAAKSGGGGQAQAQAQAPSPAPASAPSPGGSTGGSLVSVSVNWNGVQSSTQVAG